MAYDMVWMEHKLVVLAMVLGVALGICLPALLGAIIQPTTPMFVQSEQKSPLGGEATPPKAVQVPEASAERTVGEFATTEEAGPGTDRYLMALALPIVVALVVFLAFNFLLKKG